MIQCQALNAILKRKDMSFVVINNIDVSFFCDYSNEFTYIKEHYDTYGNVPDIATFISKFPKFDVLEVNESDNYLVDELYKDKNKRLLANTFNRVRDLIIKDNTEEALNYYMKSLDDLSAGKHLDCVDLIHDTSRYEKYLEKCKDYSKYYVSTGFKELDKLIGGWDRTEELATIVARTGVGKAQPLSTKIITPTGYKLMRDIKVDDYVINRYGKPVRVIDVFPQGLKEVYKITFKDGTSTKCCKEHLWTYKTRDDIYRNRDWRVDTLECICEHHSVKVGQPKASNLWLPINNAVEYSATTSVNVDPYTYGKTCAGEISDTMLYLPVNDRARMLNGFMDSRGVHTCQDVIYFRTVNKQLAESFMTLCRSLGYRCKNYPRQEGTRTKYWIRIYTSDNLFANSKYARKSPPQKRYERLAIEKIEKLPVKEECQCIMIDSPDHTYLCDDFIVTHNTWVMLKTAVASAQQGLNVGIYSGEMSENKVGYRLDTLISHISNTKIMHGNDTIQNEYKQYLDTLKDNIKGSIKVITPNMINGTAGINALRAFIEKENLDILFIDQHSLLDDDRKAKNPVERASNISKDLKNLQVMKKIPIISISQQNRIKNDDGVNTNNIAQSDRIAQDSTCILFLEQTDGVMTINLVKARDATNNKKLNYAVDFDKGIFTYVPNEDEPHDAQQCEDLREEFEYTTTGDDVF